MPTRKGSGMRSGKFLTSLVLLWCLWDPDMQRVGLCYPFRDQCPGGLCYSLAGDLEDPRLDPELDQLIHDSEVTQEITPE